MKLRSHLIALVVVAVLPVVIFSGIMVYIAYHDQRADLERGMRDTARALSLAVDRDLEVSIHTLQALGTSEHLDLGNLRQFYEQAGRVLKSQERWSTIALFDSGGHQVMNLLRPFGSSLPIAPPVDPGIKNTSELKRPLVSNLFFGRVARQAQISVNVPVIRNGEVRHVLAATFLPLSLVNLLKKQNLPEDWLSTIIDRNKVIIARTKDFEEFVGKTAAPLFAAKSNEGQEGVFRGFDYESAPVYAGFHRSELSGWTVALGVPIAEVEASLKRSLVLMAIGGSALLLAAVTLAAILASRIAGRVSALAGAAEQLGRGEPVKIPVIPVAEVDHIAREIEMAAANRMGMEATLRANEERFRTLAETAPIGIFLSKPSGEWVYANPLWTVISGLSSEESLDQGWTRAIHRDDRARVAESWRAAAARGENYATDYRVITLAEELRWVHNLATPQRDASGTVIGYVGTVEDITERRQTEETLCESEARTAGIVAAAMDAIISADSQQRVVLFNAAAEKMFGYRAADVLGQSLDRFIPRRFRAQHFHHIEAFGATGVTTRIMDERRQISGVRANGEEFPIEASISQIGTGEQKLFTVILRDITARKQAEDLLRAQNTELQILHETSQTILASRNLQKMAASILDKAVAVSLCDLGVIRLLDRTSMTLDPIASHGYLNPKNLQRHRRHLDDGTMGRLLRIFARKETVVLEKVEDEPGLRIFKREGVQSLILIPVLAEHDLLGALQLGSRVPRKFDPHLINLLETLGSNFGIAVQKNRLLEETLASQAQLRALSHRLVKAQESERHHLARELHDEIGSLLTGLKLTLGGSAGPGTDQVDARMAAADAIIDEALAKTRSLSHSLRPPMLDDLGLLSALSWHIKEFTARANVQVNFQHYDLQGRFPAEVEIAAYRIVQEALTNIARHAQVHEATVTLWADQSGLGIEISDLGSGFDQTATLANASGIGLAGMRERVVSLGGSLTITSAPGSGTSVTVELPLAMGERTVRGER